MRPGNENDPLREDGRLAVSARIGTVSTLVVRPRDARAMLVLGHGAGAGMRHAFLEDLADRLAAHTIATFRYQFPYREQGRRSPSPRPVLLQTVRAAVDEAKARAPDLPLLAGGKSMGGRMTSLAASQAPLPGVHGLVFFGFPLHAARRPSIERGEHLHAVDLPMLFLQGTRDTLADLELVRPLCARLGPRATLHVVEGGDHSFHVLKRSGRTGAEALEEVARVTAAWISRVLD